jgi:hypothetical protein
MELANFLEKNQRLQVQIQAVTLKITSCTSMHNFLTKKTKNPRFYGLKKHFFGYPTLQPLGSFSHMIGSRSSLKITRKMKFIQEK